jgi:ADP-heptose:LPS heptosyltransferase
MMSDAVPHVFRRSFYVQGWRRVVTRWLARPLPHRRGPHYRAAIVKLDRLGDGVLALGAIRTILRHYGETECLLVVSPHAADLMAIEFPRTPRTVLPVTMLPGRLLREGIIARRKLSRVTCDAVICLRHQREDWDELVLAWLGGARTYLIVGAQRGTSFAGRHLFAFQRADAVSMPPAGAPGDSCGELNRHRHLLSHALGRIVSAAETEPRCENIRRAKDEPTIVVSPFARTAIRDFPEPLLVAALHTVREHSRAPIALYGVASQQDRLQRLRDHIRGAGITDVACRHSLGLEDFAGTIQVAEMVLTGDTATAHLAAAFDRRSVILIGGGHPGDFGPWGRSSKQVWLTERMDCFGCDWHCVHPEPFCLTGIPAKAVKAAVARLYLNPEGGVHA